MPEEEEEEETMGELSEKGENIITKAEFGELESQEGGPELEEVEAKEEEEEIPEEAGRLDQLTMRIDKLEAMLETVQDERDVFNERIRTLSEEIGELRSSLVSEGEDLDELEQKFTKIKGTFEEVEPGRFQRSLDKKEEKITKNRAEIEGFQEKLKTLRKRTEKIDDMLSGIKNIENLADLSTKIEEKMDEIEESKNYTDRRAAKVENLFSELSERLNEFGNYKDKIDANKETIAELMKSVDKISIKVEKAIDRDDLNELKEELKEDIEKTEMDFEKKIYETSNLIEELVSRMRGKDLNKIYSDYEDLKKLKERVEELESSREEIVSWVESMKTEGRRAPPSKREIKEKETELVSKPPRMEEEVAPRGVSAVEPSVEKKKTWEEIGEDIKKTREGLKSGLNTLKNRMKEIKRGKKRGRKFETREEVPAHIRNWIEKNLDRGYSPRQLKLSLKKSGQDPALVEKYIRREGK